MQYWLIKSDPETYSFERMKKEKTTFWEGVRNYAARNNLKAMNSITKQDLLDFLSGDLYKTEGNIFHENTSEFLVQMTGQQLGTLQALFKQFEEWMKVAAKKLFKKAGLSHWEESAKVIMLLIVIMIPVCFIFILTLLGIIFGIINLVSKY